MSVLFGLLRKQKYHFLHPYRDEAYSTIKATIRQVCFTTHELLCGRIKKLTSYSYFKGLVTILICEFFVFFLCYTNRQFRMLWLKLMTMKKRGKFFLFDQNDISNLILAA